MTDESTKVTEGTETAEQPNVSTSRKPGYPKIEADVMDRIYHGSGRDLTYSEFLRQQLDRADKADALGNEKAVIEEILREERVRIKKVRNLVKKSSDEDLKDRVDALFEE